ncbi:hypothetical protein A9Q84_10100 [Halobacteriovorax marinus]|uniref:Major facilitator superfamily (MFS) profile domain-containing protein n=1 Tax=Halobacteriovorax marinus TaxID=97084 RepID=A0A1Y5F7H5_9BACT|nr:hypothetical protein A9Q84_10100 [Halobacteriovorax marinus]
MPKNILEVINMKWNLILLAYLSLFALSLIDNGRAPTYYSILSDLEIGPAKGSYIFTIASFISLIVCLTAPKWLPRIGPVKGTRLSLLFLAASGICLYFTGRFLSYPLLLVSSALLGLGIAICSLTMNILIMKGSTSELRRKVFSGLHAIYGFSSLLAPFVLAGILKIGGDWKIYFLAVSTLPVLVLLMTSKTDNLLEKEEQGKALEKGVPLKVRILFGVLFGCYVGSELVISSRLPYYLNTHLKLDEVTSGYYLSLFFLFLTMGRIIFSLKHFNIKSEILLLVSFITTLISFTLGHQVHPFFLSLMGLFMSYAFPTALDYLVQVFDLKSDYMLTSVMTWIGVVLGFVHFFFGMINESYGANIALLISPFLSLCSLSALMIFLKMKKV